MICILERDIRSFRLLWFQIQLAETVLLFLSDTERFFHESVQAPVYALRFLHESVEIGFARAEHGLKRRNHALFVQSVSAGDMSNLPVDVFVAEHVDTFLHVSFVKR